MSSKVTTNANCISALEENMDDFDANLQRLMDFMSALPLSVSAQAAPAQPPALANPQPAPERFHSDTPEPGDPFDFDVDNLFFTTLLRVLQPQTHVQMHATDHTQPQQIQPSSYSCHHPEP